MSHLRPHDPETGTPKKLADYTPDEAATAVSEMEAASLDPRRPSSEHEMRLASSLIKKTARKDSAPELVMKPEAPAPAVATAR